MLTIDEGTHKEVVHVTLCLTIKITANKLKQWIKVHLSEDLFYDEFKNKEFKKRLAEKSLLVTSLANCTLNNDLESSKMSNTSINKVQIALINNDLDKSYNNKAFDADSKLICTSDMFNEIKV